MRRTAHIVLAMLNHSATTAYALRRALRRRMDFIWSESSGQLYPAIKALIDARLITEQREDSITDEGRLEVEKWLTTTPASRCSTANRHCICCSTSTTSSTAHSAAPMKNARCTPRPTVTS